MGALIVGTVIYLIVFVIAAYFIQDKATKDVNDQKLRSEYRSMAIGLTFLAVFCMWLMWISVYMHQMYPLINPILEVHSK